MRINPRLHGDPRKLAFRRSCVGFSLIELVVAMLIVSILAAIAVPSYVEHQRKARRTAGAACLSTVAQALERYYTTTLTYVGAPNATTLSASCSANVSSIYTITLSNLTAKTYTVIATPKGIQRGDSCGTLSINQTGARSTTSGSNCWGS